MDSAPLGYVLKPFGVPELRTAIEMALYKSDMDRKLMDSQERLTALVESVPTGSVIVDRDGRINLVNARALKMFGYRMDELVHQPVENLLPGRFRCRACIFPSFCPFRPPLFQPLPQTI